MRSRPEQLAKFFLRIHDDQPAADRCVGMNCDPPPVLSRSPTAYIPATARHAHARIVRGEPRRRTRCRAVPCRAVPSAATLLVVHPHGCTAMPFPSGSCSPAKEDEARLDCSAALCIACSVARVMLHAACHAADDDYFSSELQPPGSPSSPSSFQGSQQSPFDASQFDPMGCGDDDDMMFCNLSQSCPL